MEREEILGKLNEIFNEVLEEKDIQLTEVTTANDIDGWDSLSNMMIITKVEKLWGFKFKLHDIIRMRNVGDLVSNILKYTK